MEQKRLRDLRAVIGNYETGLYNAITDVQGVQVGHVTLFEKDTVRTGVTATLHGTIQYMLQQIEVLC
ncbi:P1 family peptidase [Bacillus sp. TL12]|uniref:P1 family peptidase n=1 Tax=Bacillus sp. TL12 TaxID=2894756 RepID=UPI001F51AD08|nr:P1 family peptidase [Bacillus sp. TL12]MCI0765204.1 P1 family peptidase [Bacillus sp. TL12]